MGKFILKIYIIIQWIIICDYRITGAPVGQSGPIPSSPNFQQPSFPSFGGVPVR
jgi:hypothetical protein